MAFLQVGKSAGTRIEVGDRVIAASKTLDMSPVARPFARFRAAHTALQRREREAREAEDALRAAQRDAAQADVALDHAVEKLASALVGEGAPRLKPFTAVNETRSPSAIRKMKQAEQAKLCIGIAKRLERHPSAAVRRAAEVLRTAATALAAKHKPLDTKGAAFSEAITIRLGPEQEWENAFAALKDAARAARHEDGGRIFDTLFQRTAKRGASKGRGKKKAAAEPAPAS